MTGMEAAIRGALDKAGIPGAQARRRIYDSARSALDRSLERQGITDPERIDDHRHRLEVLIASIEAEWTPPSESAPAPPAEAPAVESPHHAAPATPQEPVQPAPVRDEPAAWQRPVYDVPEALGPEALGPEHDVPVAPAAQSSKAAASPAGTDHAKAPEVAAVAPEARSAGAGRSDADLDFAPEASGLRASPAAKTAADHAQPGTAAKAEKPARKPKAPKQRKEKRRRPIFASIFSGAVMLSFLGIGIWWLIESGALKSAAERDTGVPNPPPSLSRDDFAGGPQQLNPGSGFSGEWSNVFTPGRDGEPRPRGDASVDLIRDAEAGDALRIVSRTGDASGEVLIPLGPEVMQALAGRQSMLALTVRSASPEPTQVYVRCEFSVLGDCGRHRFNVTYDTNDILFSVDYDRALAPNEGGSLVINSDISGAGKAIDLIAVRIRPMN